MLSTLMHFCPAGWQCRVLALFLPALQTASFSRESTVWTDPSQRTNLPSSEEGGVELTLCKCHFGYMMDICFVVVPDVLEVPF